MSSLLSLGWFTTSVVENKPCKIYLKSRKCGYVLEIRNARTQDNIKKCVKDLWLYALRINFPVRITNINTNPKCVPSKKKCGQTKLCSLCEDNSASDSEGDETAF